MLTRTTEMAVQALIFLALREDPAPLSPRTLARSLGCSPSYLAKTLAMLVRAGLLRSTRGVNGGVSLLREAEEIRMLDIVEACQGLLVGNYCRDLGSAQGKVCSFHLAMEELHDAMVEILSRWTLSNLLECPARPREPGENHACKMWFEDSALPMK